MITIDIRDAATPALRKLREDLSGLGPKQAGAAAGVELLRTNFFRLGAMGNKQGFPSGHFYQDAAGATRGEADPDGIYFAVDKTGVRQRWLGGTIQSKDRLLTFPANARSYGKRADEFSGSLHVGFGLNPATDRMQLALLDTTGAHPVMSDGKKKEAKGTVMYWLARKATQIANPDVIPSPERILDAVRRGLDEYFLALRERKGGWT
jgi:hypothetical protein